MTVEEIDAIASTLSVPELAAETYAHRSWHALTPTEQELVKRLEQLGYLELPQAGFVGRATRRFLRLQERTDALIDQMSIMLGRPLTVAEKEGIRSGWSCGQ